MKWAYACIYCVIWIVCMVSYGPAREVLIAQAPPLKPLIVSNLTVSYVIFFLLIGALGTKVPRWINPKTPRWVGVPASIMIGCIFIVVMKLAGMDMRF